MRRAPSLVLIVCLLFGVLLSSTPATAVMARADTDIDWLKLPYFEADNGWFRVTTNAQTFGGKTIASTDPLSKGDGFGSTQEEVNGLRLEGLWAGKCQAVKPQTVKLTRHVYLPGTPSQLQASLFVRKPSSGKSPITDVSILINGREVYKVQAAKGAPLADSLTRKLVDLNAADSPIAYGENTIAVIAHKKETTKKQNVCSIDNSPAFFMELYGEFIADLTATIPHGQGGFLLTKLPVTVTNNGPSDYFSQGNAFSFWATGTSRVVDGLSTSDALPTTDQCTVVKNYSNASTSPAVGKEIVCPLPHIAPGESLAFDVLLGHDSCPGADIFFGYHVFGYFEDAATRSNDGEHDRKMQCSSD